jgi:ubiquinone/menaquinone biosynthesis C-methylase UbiE
LSDSTDTTRHKPIHHTAARGFERAGAEYERGRPNYPNEAIELLARELRIGPGRKVVDVGAGTGKLTRDLVALGADVIALEPVPAMREQLVAALPTVQALNGIAEEMPIPDKSVDAVTVGQAFHWFDATAASIDIHRVLKPGGGLGVVSNGWDLTVPWVSKMQEVVHSYAGETPRHDTSTWREQLAATGLFTVLQERVFPHVVSGDLTTLLFRVSSVSYISVLEERERAHVLRKVAEIVGNADVAKQSAGLDMAYMTKVWWCTALRR